MLEFCEVCLLVPKRLIGRVVGNRTQNILSITEKSGVRHIYLASDSRSLPRPVDNPEAMPHGRLPTCLKVSRDKYKPRTHARSCVHHSVYAHAYPGGGGTDTHSHTMCECVSGFALSNLLSACDFHDSFRRLHILIEFYSFF